MGLAQPSPAQPRKSLRGPAKSMPCGPHNPTAHTHTHTRPSRSRTPWPPSVPLTSRPHHTVAGLLLVLSPFLHLLPSRPFQFFKSNPILLLLQISPPPPPPPMSASSRFDLRVNPNPSLLADPRAAPANDRHLTSSPLAMQASSHPHQHAIGGGGGGGMRWGAGDLVSSGVSVLCFCTLGFLRLGLGWWRWLIWLVGLVVVCDVCAAVTVAVGRRRRRRRSRTRGTSSTALGTSTRRSSPSASRPRSISSPPTP